MQGGGACQHRPQGLVAASSAPASLLGLMNASGHAQTVSACVATLNNLCASDDGADRVFEEAKRFAPHVSPHASSKALNEGSRHPWTHHAYGSPARVAYIGHVIAKASHPGRGTYAEANICRALRE